jgi:hypothetical protein
MWQLVSANLCSRKPASNNVMPTAMHTKLHTSPPRPPRPPLLLPPRIEQPPSPLGHRHRARRAHVCPIPRGLLLARTQHRLRVALPPADPILGGSKDTGNVHMCVCVCVCVVVVGKVWILGCPLWAGPFETFSQHFALAPPPPPCILGVVKFLLFRLTHDRTAHPTLNHSLAFDTARPMLLLPSVLTPS